MIGDFLVNHDLALPSPSSSGFQQLLNICSNCGVDFDDSHNAKKSVVMVCRTNDDMDINLPAFQLSGQTLGVSNSTKYLGHIITDTLEDDANMFRQGGLLYVQANMLVGKFHH